MIVVALIADLVRSRRIADRVSFQQRMKSILRELSETSGGLLLSPYTLTLGDEFQAVFRDFSGVLSDLMEIQRRIAPVTARFALAAGTLSTAINPAAALEMDGPAFICARELMARLKSQHRSVIQVGWAEGAEPELANSALSLLAGTMEGWKPGTHAIFSPLLAGASVEEIARRTGLSQRGVYKHIAGRHLQEARALLHHVTLDLNKHLVGAVQ